MVYDTNEEMNNVVGRLEDNSFIQQQLGELDEMRKLVKSYIRKMKLRFYAIVIFTSSS